MGITKETLATLVALQKSDSVLDKLQAEMDLIPKQIAVLREELDRSKARMTQAKSQILDLEKKKKEKELDLASKEESIRKHNVELNQVKSNEAFKALQAEIDQAKAAVGQGETDILEIMEGIDASRREEKAAAAEFKAAEGKAQGEISALEKVLAGLKADFDGKKAVRDQAAAAVPADMLKIYDHGRSRGKLDVIVPVDGGNCSACRINLAPQMIIEVAKAKSLVVCESCQRILYKPESAEAKPAEAKPAEAKPA
jgi:predicted  nucleic acid-binding Zn-ribbon protein